MLARVFALVRGKGTQCPPLNYRSDLVSSALLRCSRMPQQFDRRSFLSDRVSQEHPLRKNNNRGAPPACTFQSNWNMQNHLSPKENSADSSLESTKDTLEGNLYQRFAILKSIGKCINEDDLSQLLKKKNVPICYVWCDPSPTMHITQGITMTINVNKMVKAGCKVKIFMADWFACMDRRIGRSHRKIQDICAYNIEMWKATGMHVDGVEFVHLSDEISFNADQYFRLAMDIARKTELSKIRNYINLSRDTRWYGNTDLYMPTDLFSSEILDTCFKCAAILSHKVDIWLLDIGQGAANMVARQYCECRMRENQPIVLFHNVLPSLFEYPEIEMWGDPRWAIFMEDTEIFRPFYYYAPFPIEITAPANAKMKRLRDVGRAMRKAFCPLRIAEGNPCLEYIKHIIFPLFGEFEVVRKEEKGGNKMFLSMSHLTTDYENGALQPDDVKQSLEKAINKALQPIRDHFTSSAEAKKLLEAMQGYY